MLLLSRQGKVRLAKWYTTLSQKERGKITKEVSTVVLARPAKLCNFVDWKVRSAEEQAWDRMGNWLLSLHAK